MLAPPPQTEPGTTALDPHSLRRTLGRFGTGVCIVTTRTPDGRPIGLTINSFASVSLDPPLVLWSLATKSGLRPVFDDSGRFCVSILADEQAALSTRFARSAEDRFAGLDLIALAPGDVVIPGATAFVACALERRIEAGDHVIYLGRVERHEATARAPLLVLSGAYGQFTPLG